MSGGVVFWPWAECVVALFIYLSAIITKAKMTRIGACVLGEPLKIYGEYFSVRARMRHSLA